MSAWIKRRAILFLIILVGLVPMAAPTPASSTIPQCRFDPDGYFYIKGGPPKGFAEFGYIQLQTGNSGQPPTVGSHLSAGNGKSYRFAGFRTHSSGGGITFDFTTETIDGVNYKFSGKFDSICVLAETERDPEKVVALGTLMKFEKGKQKEAADVELTYSPSPRPKKSKQSNDGSAPADGTGRDVLAIVARMELKAHTDNLDNGAVLVSDIIRFDVVEPKELTHIAVTAYYQGAPNVQGKRLQVGDLVRFELPSEPQRLGILLGDLKGLRFRE